MQLRLIVVADGATADVDADDTMIVARPHLTIIDVFGFSEATAHRGQTATAINGAKDGATIDIKGDIAAHRTCGEGVAVEATTAAKHVAVDVGVAPRADMDIVGGWGILTTDIHRHVPQHVAILATAEGRAKEEGIAADVDLSIGHVGPSVEHDTRVTHACAKEIASNRMSLD